MISLVFCFTLIDVIPNVYLSTFSIRNILLYIDVMLVHKYTWERLMSLSPISMA